MMKKVCYITGTRADFGLMKSLLLMLRNDPEIDLSLIITGMHLSQEHGMTVKEIEQAGFSIEHQVPLEMSPYTGATMSKNIGHMLIGFTEKLVELTPNLLLLLGDRGEMLAGALAAAHLNIHIAHVNGGERSGTIDEPVRHAITKLSHFHMTTTDNARERLIKMGECEQFVWTTGAPGIDDLLTIKPVAKSQLCEALGLDENKPTALFVYHPVLQEHGGAGEDTRFIIEQLLERGMQIVAVMPNADAGSQAIRDVLVSYYGNPAVKAMNHLHRDEFLAWMAQADLMLGNSSAGILEAASFGTPVINIGVRQNLRERNHNTIDILDVQNELLQALDKVQTQGRFDCANVYGDGTTSKQIWQLIKQFPLSAEVLLKVNSY